MRRPLTACKESLRYEKRALRRPFLSPQLFQHRQELRAFPAAQPRSHAPLVSTDALLEAGDQSTPGARKPETIGATVLAAAALDQLTRLQGMQHPHHGGTVDAHRLREPALGDAGVRVDQQ